MAIVVNPPRFSVFFYAEGLKRSLKNALTVAEELEIVDIKIILELVESTYTSIVSAEQEMIGIWLAKLYKEFC
ncbi:hypothetical protein OPS25_06480 [Alteromonas ponticola]|uniref:Uncharacterized protein n=1 Tax=Alteromonas aquimaris TaxID=2998417 RepID=A0ABT3P7R8_9ALTE|nr:hypothetical protein [Alteromonas aquimaris]MCW8108136.1 hypothetical protein [Alteromonas aquimaris]